MPVPGKRIKRRAAEDSSSDNKRTIQMDQLMSNLSTLQPLKRIMLIVDDSRSLTLEEKLDSAFRLPETEESYKNNMNLFNSYMRGGLEYLYQNLIVRRVSPEDEDYGDARISNMMALLKSDWGCGRFLGPELSNSKTASILHRTQTP